MVLQIIRFYEERLGREINEAEQEAVRTMYEEFRRLKAPDHSKEEGSLLAQVKNPSLRTMCPYREAMSETGDNTNPSLQSIAYSLLYIGIP